MFSENINSKSFTLIELLVVIAIIGLLSSVVLVSMKGTRGKAKITKGLQFSQTINHTLGAYALGVWDFNDSDTSGIANDCSGYANHGTIIGATYVGGASTSDDATPHHVLGQGEGQYALNFDGIDDYVQFSYNANSQPDVITIEYWIKLTSDPDTSGENNYRMVFSASGFGAPCDLILEQNRSTCFSVWVGGSRYRRIGGIFSSERLTVDRWAHLVYIYDSSDGWGYAYKNGEISRQGEMISGGGNLDNSSRGWRISSPSTAPSRSIPGIIDGFRIYERALGAAEIQKHYAESAPRHGIVLK